MLRGSFTANIDDKGRLRIPAVYKRFFEEEYAGATNFYVTSLTGENVLIYPMREWEIIESKLAALPSQDPTRKKFLDRTSYFGNEQSVDTQGRIVIPPMLRSQAGLLGEVLVVGELNYLEVWSADTFRARMNAQPWTDEDAEKIARLGV
jgi:MraZ protein